MKRDFANTHIGVLGGGQLARMLALRGQRLGLKVHVLSPSEDDPAAQVTGFWHKGSPANLSDLKSFLNQVDVATFESEFSDPALIQSASRATGVKVLPKPGVMARLQDRLPQKKLLLKTGFATADFVPVNSFDQARQALAHFSKGFVLKQRRFGYDGYGTFVISNQRDLNQLETIIESNGDGFIAEELINFRRELAVMAARNRKGEIVFLPLVETKQVDSRCFWVKGPTQHKKFSALKRSIKSLLQQIKYEGVIAFELFDTGSDLLVNEVAPRVHNSGHYSLDGLSLDQFSLHLLAILNEPLPDSQLLAPGFAMVNLLGQSNRAPKWHIDSGVLLHWYGKSENRKGRKMGHINMIGKSADHALKTLLKKHKEFQL